MRKRTSFVILLALLVTVLATSASVAGGGARLRSWFLALHGHGGRGGHGAPLHAPPAAAVTTPAVLGDGDNPTNRSATIPFELYANKIFVKVTVKGQKPAEALSFVLDTGAKWAMIDLARAKALGLRLKGEIAVHGAGEKTTPGRFVDDERFQVVGLRSFSQPLFIAMPLDELAGYLGHRFDGILGFEFLSQFAVEIDWARRQLTLHDKASFTYNGPGLSLPLEFDAQSHPLVNASLLLRGKEKPGSFLVDIGANNALTLNTPFVEEERLTDGPGGKTVPVTARGAGGAVKGVAGRVDGLKIGNWLLEKPVTVFSRDRKGADAVEGRLGRIGVEILRRFRVILDFERNRLILSPTAQIHEPFEHDMSGLVLQAVSADFKVLRIASVDETSPASGAGLQAGDTLVSLDGRPVAELDLQAVRELFRREGRYTIGIQREGKTLTIPLTTARRI